MPIGRCSGKLDVAFEDGGEQELKNIARPVKVYWIQIDKKPQIAAATLALPTKPSIAVLAFQNMSGDLEQEYFADGIAEDVITALSRIALAVRRRAQFLLHLQRQVGGRSPGRT